MHILWDPLKIDNLIEALRYIEKYSSVALKIKSPSFNILHNNYGSINYVFNYSSFH